MTTNDMGLRGRIGGFSKAAKYMPEELTASARKGFRARFERAADPEGILAPEERERRAKALLNAHMAELARRSSNSRRKAKREH